MDLLRYLYIDDKAVKEGKEDAEGGLNVPFLTVKDFYHI